MRVLRFGLIPAACLLAGPAAVTTASAQSIELSVTASGSAASERPLPPGAMPNISIGIKNSGSEPRGPIALTVRLEEIEAGKADGWQPKDGLLASEIRTLAPGARIARALRLRVESAPLAPQTARVLVEAKAGEQSATRQLELKVADCAGAYRVRLAELRDTLAQPVRDAGDNLRKPDAALPAGRRFPAARARGELARAERLAAQFAARRGADPQFATEWFRYLLARWASELNAYTRQASNPGLCANNEMQIAGYRRGLAPLTRQIETTQAAAQIALEAARSEAKMSDGTVEAIVMRLAEEAGVEPLPQDTAALAGIAAIRGGVNSLRQLDAGLLRKLALAETAAWLAETDKRGQALLQAIDQTIAKISDAHKETCVCAF